MSDTVKLDADNRVPVGELLNVPASEVEKVDGDPDTASDYFPTSGRLAKDTTTSPPTWYIGTGSAWEPVDSYIDLQGYMNVRDVNRETLAGNKTLATGDATVQNLDPGGAARTVTLPAEEPGLVFNIANRTTGAANAITVNDDAGTTIATLNDGDVGIFVCDGTGWMGFAAAGGAT